MDKWKYYDIRHKRHMLCNPMNKEKFEKLCRLLQLGPEARVLDIACGKGEFLIRLAELYDISGVGVDISPYCISDCLRKRQNRTPNSSLEFIEMDGAEYQPKIPNSFDIAMCIGASWIYQGHCGTIKALKKMTKPGGLIIVGEPFWIKEPNEEYLKADKMKREEFGTHHENVTVGEEEGLTCIYTIVSNHDDWDHYETLGWWSIDDYQKTNPNDQDTPEILERKKREKETFLRWGRDTLGWAIYVFRKPSSAKEVDS